jgi:hypothetical protein
MRDLNIHINNEADSTAQAFLQTMEALGLIQHVTSATHNAGNTLDHIYTESEGDIKLLSCTNRDFISDHCAVFCEFDLPKENMTRKTVTYRKYRDIDYDELANDLHFEMSDTQSVDQLVATFQHNIQVAIDKHAPQRRKTLTLRKHNVWFTDEVYRQKCLVRKKERIWRGAKEVHHWRAFCVER